MLFKAFQLLKMFVFLIVVLSIYTFYTVRVNKEHLGGAVVRAYEDGNTGKLKALGCSLVEPGNKKEKRSYYTYETPDGKGLLVCLFSRAKD